MSSNGPPPAEAAGAKHFRKLVQAVAITYFSVLAIECVHQYISCLQAVPTEADIYNGLQQRSTLVYYLCWLGIAALALGAASLRRTTWLSSYLNLLLAAETVAYIFFFATHSHLYHPPVAVLYARYDPHPFVVAIPHPGVFGPVTHDEEHRRTTINEDKTPHPKLVYVFGGSTTYDVGNFDANTWPSQLSHVLGPDFAVENYGVPGFSSVENMTQSLFAFRDVAPVCAVYYEGWNDLNLSHVKDLADDYANEEYPGLRQLLALGPQPGFLERNSVLVAYALSIFATPWHELPSEGDLREKDLRLAKLYRDNIALIAAIGNSFGVRVVFIPQILNYARFTTDEPPKGVPYINPVDTKRLMALMNEDLASAAAQSQAFYVAAPLTVNWEDADFVDKGHFGRKGAIKFARSIADDVRRICQ